MSMDYEKRITELELRINMLERAIVELQSRPTIYQPYLPPSPVYPTPSDPTCDANMQEWINGVFDASVDGLTNDNQS